MRAGSAEGGCLSLGWSIITPLVNQWDFVLPSHWTLVWAQNTKSTKTELGEELGRGEWEGGQALAFVCSRWRHKTVAYLQYMLEYTWVTFLMIFNADFCQKSSLHIHICYGWACSSYLLYNIITVSQSGVSPENVTSFYIFKVRFFFFC